MLLQLPVLFFDHTSSTDGVELVIIIIGCFGQCLAGDAPSVNIVGTIIIWRFVMGIGIGGDYPLSAVIASEFAPTSIRGRLMASVFSAQGWGSFAASLIGVILTEIYKDTILNNALVDHRPLDTMWRILIGLGCIPACIAFYFRLTIPETPRFTMDIERNVQQAASDIENYFSNGTFIIDPDAIVQRASAPRASWKDFVYHFSQWKNGKILLGTCYSWLVLDIAFYGFGLNNIIVFDALGFTTPGDVSASRAVFDNLRNVSVGNVVLSIAGLIPGYYASICVIDRWGRKPIQLMGFCVLFVVFCILGFAYDDLTSSKSAKVGFAFLYCLANFFQNFGPNVTTFVIPGEVFPTRYRSTAHGISAASGKLGAIIAQVAFAKITNLKLILEIIPFIMLTGALSTLLLPETKGKTLEDLSNEKQRGFISGARGFMIDDGLVLDIPSLRR